VSYLCLSEHYASVDWHLEILCCSSSTLQATKSHYFNSTINLCE